MGLTSYGDPSTPQVLVRPRLEQTDGEAANACTHLTQRGDLQHSAEERFVNPVGLRLEIH
jgi:hypothetical protein